MKRIRLIVSLFFLTSAAALLAGPKLISAVSKGDLTAAKDLLAAGEKINEPDRYGWTPLMWASYYQYEAVLEFLLDHGADPNIQSSSPYGSLPAGATALIIASYYGKDNLAQDLVSRNARIEIADASGNTAVDYARQSDFTGVLAVFSRKLGGSEGAKVYLGKGVDGTPLPRKYTALVLNRFTADKEITEDFPNALSDCQNHTIAEIARMKGFDSVEMASAAKSYGPSTLLAQVAITEMRLAAPEARFGNGSISAISYAHARVTLVDAATGKVIREQMLSTENNPWSATWTVKPTDESIPDDLGGIIARYLLTVNPGN